MSIHEDIKKKANDAARAEEAQLIQDWQATQNPKALTKIFEKHKRLVAHIANGYRGYGLPVDDLQSEGYIGIMHALKNFDLSKGFRFHTYAFWWIKAMMNDYILANSSLVRLVKNPHQKKLFFNLSRLKYQYGNHLTPEVVTKIAEELKVPEAEVLHMDMRLQKDASLNATVKESEDTEWIDWIADERRLHDVELMQEQELHHRWDSVQKAMHALNKREYEILTQRKIKEPPIGLEELAQKYNVSKERVRQIEIAALNKVKKAVHHV